MAIQEDLQFIFVALWKPMTAEAAFFSLLQAWADAATSKDQRGQSPSEFNT